MKGLVATVNAAIYSGQLIGLVAGRLGGLGRLPGLLQAALHQLRTRLGEPYRTWDAKHLAQDLFRALDGDLRVSHDTLVVTYYNAPEADRLRASYEHLPERLADEGTDPRIPWLYDFKLDFRFK